MQYSKEWEILPQTDYALRENWRKPSKNKYAADRTRLLIIKKKEGGSVYGPVVSAHNINPYDKVELRIRREKVISHTESIKKAIGFTVSSKISDQLAAKISSRIGAKFSGLSANINSELQGISKEEVNKQIERTVGYTKSYSIEETYEKEITITLNGSDKHREAYLRRRFWPQKWDIYLYSYEYLELEYRKGLFWGGNP